ncbi:DUF7344 domain-containing protein [Halosimplex sp. J119]
MTECGTKRTSRLLDALAHRDRRIVCYYLREHETATVDRLVDLVAGWIEAGPGPNESVDRTSVRAGLHHVHLPTLDSAGLVEYEPDAGSVAFVKCSPGADEIVDAAFEADTTGARLDVEGVLAAVGSESEACRGCDGVPGFDERDREGSTSPGSGVDDGG